MSTELTLAIARVAHEVNRAYCMALGDFTQVVWEEAPQWQKDSAIAGVEMHLADPHAGPEASHKSWMKKKANEGWKYGPNKDPENKLHPCMVPFGELSPEQRAKDYIFMGVVRAIAREQARG